MMVMLRHRSGSRRLYYELRLCLVAGGAALAMLLPLLATPAATAAVVPAAMSAPTNSNGCYDTAIRGSLPLGDNQQVMAGGPNFTSGVCRDINIKLTSAKYRTWARSCLEKSGGLQCGSWVFLLYPDTWQILQPNVLGGSRWQIQMYSEGGPEQVVFYYTD